MEEGWLKLADALDLVDPILHQNARQIFRLAQKPEVRRRADWVK